MAGVNKNKLLDNATKYIQKGQLDRAIKELQKVIEADPADVRTRLKLGDLFAKKGQNAEAAEQYTLVAENYSKDGFYLKAVAVYKQILKLDSSLIDVHLKLGDLYHQLGLLSDAMSQYQIVAQHYDSKGMSKESLETLRKMVELDPENVQSRKKVAEILAREGQGNEAIEEFKKIAEDLKSKGRLDDLVAVLERIIHLDQTNLDTVRELAGLYLERGDPKRALAKLQICFRANPHDLGTLEMLSKAFVALGQPEKAKSVYREMAKLHEQAGNAQARSDAYRAILQIDPGDAEARAALEGRSVEPSMGGGFSMAPEPAPMSMAPPQAPTMESSRASGTAGAFASPMGAVLQPAPMPAAGGGGSDDPQTISKLLTEADVYLKYGLLEKALDHLRQIVRRNPGNIDAHVKLKDVFLQHKDVDGAVNEIVAVVDLAMQQGDRVRAQEALAEGMGFAPGNPMLAQKQAQVGGGGGEHRGMPGGMAADGGADALEISIDAGSEPEMVIEDAPEIDAGGGDEVEISVDSGIELPDDGGVEINIDADRPTMPAPRPAFGPVGSVKGGGGMDAPIPAITDDSVDISIADAVSIDAGGDEPAAQGDEDVAIITDSEDVIIADSGEMDSALEIEPPPPETRKVVPIESARRGEASKPSSSASLVMPPPELSPDQLISELANALEPTGGHPQAAPETRKPKKSLGDNFLMDGGSSPAPAPPPKSSAKIVAPPAPPPPKVELEEDADVSIDSSEDSLIDLETDDRVAVEDAPKPAPVPVATKPAPAQPTSAKAAPTVPVAAAPKNDDPIPAQVQEDVDEAEFFIKQKMYEDAVDVFKRLLKKFPGNGGLTGRLDYATKLLNGEIKVETTKPVPAAKPAAPAARAPEPAKPAAKVEAAKPAIAMPTSPEAHKPATKPAAPPVAEETGGFDLAAELMDELDKIADEEEEDAPSFDQNEQVSVGDVLREFRKGVEKQVGTEDKEARYNLGIAYREMGLLDEAIAEFQIAGSEPARKAECLSMVGMCQRDKGDLDGAVGSFADALKTAGINDKQKASFYYELASTLESKGEAGKALKAYQAVSAIDPAFRDVQEKLKGGGKGGGGKGGGGDGGAAPAAAVPPKKISYL